MSATDRPVFRGIPPAALPESHGLPLLYGLSRSVYTRIVRLALEELGRA